MKERKLPVWKTLAAIAVFWAMFFVGGVLIHLWNFISYSRFEPGTFGYEVFRVLANPIGCFVGIAIYQEITKKSAQLSLLINCVIGAVVAAILTLFKLLAPQVDIPTVISNALCAAAMIVGVCMSASDIRKKMRQD